MQINIHLKLYLTNIKISSMLVFIVVEFVQLISTFMRYVYNRHLTLTGGQGWLEEVSCRR